MCVQRKNRTGTLNRLAGMSCPVDFLLLSCVYRRSAFLDTFDLSHLLFLSLPLLFLFFLDWFLCLPPFCLSLHPSILSLASACTGRSTMRPNCPNWKKISRSSPRKLFMYTMMVQLPHRPPLLLPLLLPPLLLLRLHLPLPLPQLLLLLPHDCPEMWNKSTVQRGNSEYLI